MTEKVSGRVDRLSQAEPAKSGLGPSDFDPARIAASAHLTRYPAARVIALAEHAAGLGIICHIDGFPFGAAHGE